MITDYTNTNQYDMLIDVLAEMVSTYLAKSEQKTEAKGSKANADAHVNNE